MNPIRDNKTNPGPLRMIVYGATKCGKALPVEAPVVTPTGYRPIGTLAVGDAVIGADGRATEVTGVFPQGVKPVYQVTFGDRTRTWCCAEHLWHIRTGDETHRGQPGRVLALQDFMDDLYVGDIRKYRIPMTAPVQFAAGEKLSTDPYLLGLLIGDGSFRSGSPSFSNPESDLLARIDELIKPFELQRKHKGTNPDRVDWLLTRERGQGNPLIEQLRQLGLWGRSSVEKFIPKSYLLASVEARLQLLRGLLDTDGDVNARGISVTANTSSPRLKDDIVFLIESLGGTARWHSRQHPKYRHNDEQREGHEAFRINVRLPVGVCPVSSEKHLARWREDSDTGIRHPPTRCFDSVEADGYEECVCIKVANEDGLFLTNDFIVTHNTRFAGTFPNPFFFAVGPEAGVATLTQFEQSIKHTLIDSVKDMQEALRWFKESYVKEGFRTAVVDTASVYGRMISMLESGYGERAMDQTKWYKVLSHFLHVRDTLHSLPIHVVWVMHEEDDMSGSMVLRRGPKLVGAAKKEIMQTCGLIAYLTKTDRPAKRADDGRELEPAHCERALWVRCLEGFNPPFEHGSWYDQALPEPCLVPHFDVLAKRLAPKHITV